MVYFFENVFLGKKYRKLLEICLILEYYLIIFTVSNAHAVAERLFKKVHYFENL